MNPASIRRFIVSPVAPGLPLLMPALCLAPLAVPMLDAAPPPGLVLHLDFEKAPVNGMFPDLSGKKNHAKLAGAKWSTSGKTNGGLECGTTRSGALVAATPTPVQAKATFAVWFKSAAMPPHQRWVIGNDGFRLTIAGDSEARGKMAAELTGNPRCLSDAVVANGEWHHAAATFDGTQLMLFLDGIPQKQVLPCKAPFAARPGPLFLGVNPPTKPGQPDACPSLDGLIDEVMVFDRALAAEEIKQIIAAVDPNAGNSKGKFTKAQIDWQIKTLDQLYQEGYLTDSYYTRKVRELQALIQE